MEDPRAARPFYEPGTEEIRPDPDLPPTRFAHRVKALEPSELEAQHLFVSFNRSAAAVVASLVFAFVCLFLPHGFASSTWTLLAAIALWTALADSIGNHYAHWLLANPRAKPQAHAAWESAWRRRFSLRNQLSVRYVSSLALAATVFAGLSFLSKSAPHLALGLFAVTPLVACLATGARSELPRAAIRSFLTYGLIPLYGQPRQFRHDGEPTQRKFRDAEEVGYHGIFRSPSGVRATRTATFIVGSALATAATVGHFAFFQVGYSEGPFAPVALETLTASAESRGMLHRYARFSTGNSSPSLGDALNESPFIHFGLSLSALLTHWEPALLAPAVASAVALALSPGLSLLLFFNIAALPPIQAIGLSFEVPDAPEAFTNRATRALYNWRLRTAPTPEERRCHFFGTHASFDVPLLLDERCFQGHAWCLGSTRSHKTASAVYPTAAEMIRRGDRPVIIFDFKGTDNDFRNAIQADAETARRLHLKKHPHDTEHRKFKLFTTQAERATHALSLWDGIMSTQATLNETAQLILQAIELIHGKGYGRDYFSKVSLTALRAALELHPDLSSFEELRDVLRNDPFVRKEGRVKEADDLLNTVESFARTLSINPVPPEQGGDPEVWAERIQPREVLLNNQVVFFSIPASRTPVEGDIARLLVYTFWTLQADLVQEGHRNRAYVFLDEFQAVASRSWAAEMQQASGTGISLILSNQTATDLITADAPHLLETVQNNTNLQVCFTVNDATTLRMVKDFIPTVLEYYEGPARYDAKGNRLPNEQVYQAPRFSNNDLLELTNAPGMALCRVKQGFGYTDTAGTWIPLHLPFAITAEQHAEYSAKPWPAKQPGMLVIPRRPEAPPAPPTYPERLLAARLIAPDDLASRLLAPPVSNDWTNRFAELEKLLADRTPTEAPPNA